MDREGKGILRENREGKGLLIIPYPCPPYRAGHVCAYTYPIAAPIYGYVCAHACPIAAPIYGHVCAHACPIATPVWLIYTRMHAPLLLPCGPYMRVYIPYCCSRVAHIYPIYGPYMRVYIPYYYSRVAHICAYIYSIKWYKD